MNKSDGTLNVRKITEFTEFQKIKDTWDTLLTESGNNNPYLTHDWFRITYRYFEKQAQLFILLVNDNDKVIAIAPFLFSNDKFNGISIRKIRFLENVHTPFQDFILTQKKQEALNSIANFLQDNFQLWDFIELLEIRENSESIKTLADLCREGNIFHHQFLISSSWSVPTNLSLEEGSAKLKPKVRREQKRKVRRIEKLGKLSFQIFTELADIEKHLDTFFKIHEQTWKGKEQNAQFYYHIAHEFSKRKEFIIYCLSLNEHPIAYTFCLKYKNSLFCVKTTFDSSYYAFSPGSIIFYKILENSYTDKDIKSFDIGRGDELYKQELETYPINQINFIAGHKKTFVSYFLNVRFKLVLSMKKKKLTRAILTFFKDMYVLIKKTPEYFNEKRKKLWENRQIIVFHKQLSLLKDDNKDSIWSFKKADLDDIEHLTVAMKEKRISHLKERLANETCYLVKKDEKIQNYFWFSQNNIQADDRNTINGQINLTDFDQSVFKMDTTSLEKIFNEICNELAEDEYNGLFAYSNQIDVQRRELFESLGFKTHRVLKHNGK